MTPPQRAGRTTIRRFVGDPALSSLRSLRNNPVGAVAFGILVAIVLIALLAPAISPYDPTAVTSATLKGPSWTHFFGTDQFGRDVFSRILWGSRITLFAAVVGVAISSAIGIPLGLVAGYTSRWTSSLIMRLVDVLLAFPGLLLALIIVAIAGTGLRSVIIAIGVAFIPVFARLVYGATLAAKANDYVDAARLVGCGSTRIVLRHIVPNVAGQIVVVASSAVGWAILTATTLNFLGFGVSPPTAEWGVDLSAGKAYLYQAWWTSTFPGIAITVTILAVNYFGDHAAALLEPRSRQKHVRRPAAAVPAAVEAGQVARP